MSLAIPAWLEVSQPSIDRPFGIYLWSAFDKLWSTVFGVSVNEFQFVRNSELPFSSTRPVLLAIVVYYIVIFGGREIMKHLPAFRLKILFQLHNFMLTTVSLTLLVLLVEQLFPILVRHGLLYAICDYGSWTQPIVTLYYLNYLTKFVELFDTVFLVLKKKPLTFLHTYHHGATALLCYTQLIGRTSVSWVPIVLNLFVHVIMYWYYFLSASDIRVWWKEWVTRIQIIQFIIDLFFVYFASYTYFTSTYWPFMPNMGSCAGEEFAAIYGCALLSSYLVLFISFYIRVYKKNSNKRAAAKAAAAKNVSEVKRTEAVTSGTASPNTRSRRA
ncbi:putative fatty acid elongase [Nadsonia fulvescens var. elongata DSM 6958]|uniref:Elongation of fatty acids protein n=1 Tax=Nadsonia fulvescens var. elongata DSM 6958 TaxID=857566 RepID=A0A1E3PDB0_9ASCO|nr:putative fatty acid elongase [Nadsonia fulvescens var. elongata DSM 6958]